MMAEIRQLSMCPPLKSRCSNVGRFTLQQVHNCHPYAYFQHLPGDSLCLSHDRSFQGWFSFRFMFIFWCASAACAIILRRQGNKVGGRWGCHSICVRTLTYCFYLLYLRSQLCLMSPSAKTLLASPERKPPVQEGVCPLPTTCLLL